MNRATAHRLNFAAAFATVSFATFGARPVAAQDIFLTSGSYDIADTTSRSGVIYVGQDQSGDTSKNGVPYVATLNIKTGAIVYAASGYNTSTLNITGGVLNLAYTYNSIHTNLRSGTVGYAYGYDASVMDVSGGTLLAGLEMMTSTTAANFTGTGLSYAYNGYSSQNPYTYYADTFTISGNFSGAISSYVIYLFNPNGPNGTPNLTPRQFTFNGGTPVAAVPEAGALALLLPALAISALARRRTFRVYTTKP